MTGDGEIIRVEIGSVASSLVCSGVRRLLTELGCTLGVGVGCDEGVNGNDRS